MRKLAYALVAALLTATALALAAASGPGQGRASSHREAPLISDDPVADNTDVYAFVSPDKPDTVTFVANYVPLEEPAGGPNFHKFGDDVLYAINVDNSGDAKEDMSYQFRFKTKVGNPNTFLYNTGPIDTLTDPDWNMPPDLHGHPRDRKDAARLVRRSSAKVLGRNLPTPPVNIGPRSTPNYGALAAGGGQQPARRDQGPSPASATTPSSSTWARCSTWPACGRSTPCTTCRCPRRRASTASAATTRTRSPSRSRSSQLKGPKGQTTIGVYASPMRQKIRVIRGGSIKSSGPWVQVSRLAEPLINEVDHPGRQEGRVERVRSGERQPVPAASTASRS